MIDLTKAEIEMTATALRSVRRALKNCVNSTPCDSTKFDVLLYKLDMALSNAGILTDYQKDLKQLEMMWIKSLTGDETNDDIS